jgi:threonine dehydrogenase-like Zn-dependent dehydrogenase
MKTLVWEAPRVMNMREQEIPPPADDEVMICVAYAGICGSELSGYLGHNALRVPPLVMGHEFSGGITYIGQEAQTQFPNLYAGQSVTVNPLWYDGTCELCQRGMTHLCIARKLIGAHRPGAYAEFVNVPAKLVVPLPDGMSLRTGALTEPVACGVRIGELAGRLDDQDALVVGAGPIGLVALQALKMQGARRVFISDLDAERLKMADAFGGIALNARETDVVQTVRDATNGYGAVVSVDCVGTAVTRKQCVQGTRSTGTMILVGLHEETSAMPAAEIIRREIVVRGSFSYTRENFVEALHRLENEQVHLDPWIVESPLEEGGAWFERLLDAPGNVAKVLLVP